MHSPLPMPVIVYVESQIVVFFFVIMATFSS